MLKLINFCLSERAAQVQMPKGPSCNHKFHESIHSSDFIRGGQEPQCVPLLETVFWGDLSCDACL